jgi:hypothetical protein
VRIRSATLALALCCALLAPGVCGLQAGANEGTRSGAPREDAGALEAKRQQLIEKEQALKAKEEALKKLSATLDARVAQLLSLIHISEPTRPY